MGGFAEVSAYSFDICSRSCETRATLSWFKELLEEVLELFCV